MLTMSANQWMELGLRTVFVCSLIHSFAPPWDAKEIEPFPTFQKVYRLFIYVIGYIALNARSTVYPSISTQNPNGVNANAKTLNGGPH